MRTAVLVGYRKLKGLQAPHKDFSRSMAGST